MIIKGVQMNSVYEYRSEGVRPYMLTGVQMFLADIRIRSGTSVPRLSQLRAAKKKARRVLIGGRCVLVCVGGFSLDRPLNQGCTHDQVIVVQLLGDDIALPLVKGGVVIE